METRRPCCSNQDSLNHSYSDMEVISDKLHECSVANGQDCINDVGCKEEECCKLETLKPPTTLTDLVEGLHKIFAQETVNVELVHTYMSMYKSNYKEWKKYAKSDIHRYTRNLIDAGNGKFNLMLLCWNEGQGSSIHSHSNSHCFLKVLDGCVQEQLYDWPSESEGECQMNVGRVTRVEKNQVAYINDDLGLHRIENPSNSDPAITLHLYSPPFDECQTFDEKTGHRIECKVTFWSKFGRRTPFGKTGADCGSTPENN